MTDIAAPVHLSHTDGKTIARGSAVAASGRGLLIIGKPGTGKSELAISLMGLGATLIGDDGVQLKPLESGLLLAPPPNIAGQIEIRGIGILAAEITNARLHAVVNLDEVETERLPPHRKIELIGQTVPVLHKVESPYFPSSIWQYLLSERIA